MGKPRRSFTREFKVEAVQLVSEPELVHQKLYPTRAEAQASVFQYIEVFSNRVRRHSALGYLSPIEYKQAA